MPLRQRRALAAAPAWVAVVVVLSACGVAPAPTGDPSAAQPIVLEGRDAGFVLSVQIGSAAVDAGAPIAVGATLTWEGADPRAAIWGSGSGPVSFGLAQIDGDLRMDAAQTADCAQHEYARGVPVPIPFQKSGGFSADDPNAAFYRAYFADPVLRLPAGRWRVATTANGFLRPCEMDAPMVDIRLEAEILVR